MARLIFARTAHADMEGIFSYLDRVAGRPTVRKYRSLFHGFYERIADYPVSGSLRAALGTGVRIGIVSPYVVIYRYYEGQDVVSILRIVDGRRKLSGKLLSSE